MDIAPTSVSILKVHLSVPVPLVISYHQTESIALILMNVLRNEIFVGEEDA